MGKIGDLWVKLGLKKQEYDKGMKDAEQKADGFGASLGKLKGAAVAVWAAIGGAILKVGKDIVSATNQMEDRWAMFTTKAKAGWQTFVRSLASGEWKNFFSNFRAEVEAAAQLQEVLDADTEIMNSIAIQKARMAGQLADLEVAMRDQTKSYKERAAAAQRYLDMVLPIYDKEIARADKLKASQYEAFLGTTFPKGYYSDPEVLRFFDDLIVAYGDLTEVFDGKTFADIIGPIANPDTRPKSSTNNEVENQRLINQMWDDYFRMENMLPQLFDIPSSISPESIVDFFVQYERNRNGADVQALVAAITGLESARSAYDQETKKIKTALNNNLKGAVAEAEEKIDIRGLEKLSDITSQVEQIEMPDIIPDDWLTRNREKIDEALAEVQRMQDIMLEADRAFADAVAQSLSGATQAFVDSVMGIEGADASHVLMNLMQPFADMAQSLGELFVAEGIGIEVAKKTLQNPLKGGGALIAAGVGLIAIGSALTAGIQAIGRGASGGASTSYSGEGASAANTETYKTELTVYVEGRISGKDIVLSGNNTLSSWRR